jgi:hypothetical protein
MQSARHKGTRGDLTFNERVDLAIDHFNWLAARQHQGHLVVRAFEPRPKDGSIVTGMGPPPGHRANELRYCLA